MPAKNKLIFGAKIFSLIRICNELLEDPYLFKKVWHQSNPIFYAQYLKYHYNRRTASSPPAQIPVHHRALPRVIIAIQ